MRLSTLIIALSMAGLVGCTEEIDFDLNDDGFVRLVVDAELTNVHKRHKVAVSRTTSFYNNEVAPAVSGAKVEIRSANQVIPFTEDPTKPGTYYSTDSAAGEIGVEYILEIEVVDEIYTSVSKIGEVPNIDSLSFENLRNKDGGPPFGQEEDGPKEFFLMSMWFQESPTPDQQYMTLVYINGKLDTDTVSEYTFFDDQILNGEYLDDIKFDVVEANYGDSVTIEMWSLQRAYYDGIFSLFRETIYRGGLFDAPPANVESNINNGALGFFLTSGVTRRTIILDPENEVK
jgi:hypothetical protein